MAKTSVLCYKKITAKSITTVTNKFNHKYWKRKASPRKIKIWTYCLSTSCACNLFLLFFFLVLLLAAFFAAMWSVFPEEMIPEHNLFGLVITVLFCLIAETLIVKAPMPKGFPSIPPLLGEWLLILFLKNFTTSEFHYTVLSSYLFLKRGRRVVNRNYGLRNT